VILLFTAITYYLAIHYILTNELDKDLTVEEQEINAYLQLYKKLPPPGNFKDQIVKYSSTDRTTTRLFSDTVYWNSAENENEPGRMLVTTVKLNQQPVKVNIIKSKVEAEILVRIIFLITLGITVLLLVNLAIINRFVLKRIWKPFYVTLSQLQRFNITDGADFVVEETNTDEFNDLNDAARSLALRVRKDYNELKTFTDNTSHEMMTPLAVINSKLDTLLQAGPFTEKQGVLIEDVYNEMSRLSRLNQSLLLMAKIDNHLIQDKSSILLKEKVIEKIKQFHELSQNEHLSVSAILKDKSILMSNYLADILLNNLFSNAIRHNVKRGSIQIILNEQSLSFINTGKPEALNTEVIFKRFGKGDQSEGMGLGLALAMQICNYYGYQLSYKFDSSHHHFIINFNSPK